MTDSYLPLFMEDLYETRSYLMLELSYDERD